ncbi:MAG TPA: PD-(D/E)XK nuclease family protein [Phycisphaerae bacterium]|nr:PD-(D/E)XK nuclease family protein [Phycisphaerae bacterium]HUU96885.1 PD-(D/E)XK nuclease family protein [Phycisphaerae bacterium]
MPIQPRNDNRLTVSRMNCAKTCLRKHYWLYILGLRPDREAAPLRVGRRFHKGLEVAETQGEAAGTAAALAPYDAGPPPGATEDEEQSWWVERETVARLLMAHDWRWRDMEMETIATETTFEIPLRNPATGHPSRTWVLAGKRDKIARLPVPDGRLALIEYKTTSDDLDPTGDYWLRLRMDMQVSVYWLSAHDDGIEIETALFDATRKPAIRPRNVPLLDENWFKVVLDDATGDRVFKKNGEPRLSAADGMTLQTRRERPEEFGARLTADIMDRPDYYFARQEVPRLSGDLEDARYELWQMGRLLADCERYGRWPRNTNACISYGRCPCWGLCTGGFDPADGILPEGWKQVADVHPELSDCEEVCE